MLVLHSQRSKEQRDEEVTDVFDLSVEPVCHRVCIILHLCEGPCVVSLGVATSAIWKFCDSPGDLGKAVCSQNFNVKQKDTKYGFRIFQKQTPVLCIGALRSTYFIRFIILLLCCETCWIQLRCSALYGKVARATPAIKAASSIPTPTCTQYITVLHSNFSGLLKHWFVRHNIIEIDACHTLPHLCFWSFSRTSVKNSRLPLWLRRALQTFWAQHPRKMCGDAPGRSVGTKQH